MTNKFEISDYKAKHMLGGFMIRLDLMSDHQRMMALMKEEMIEMVNDVIANMETGNEYDGESIYNASAVTGDFFTTYRTEFVLGSHYYFRIFTKNSIGNYSRIHDSQVLDVLIPSLSREAQDNLEVTYTLPVPVLSETIEGIRQIYIEWDEINYVDNRNAVAVRIYASSFGYPTPGDICYDGELIFEGDITEISFLHRDLILEEDYYYTIVYVDSNGQTSIPLKVKATADGSDSLSALPLLDVTTTSYEIVNDSSIKISWGNVLPYRSIETYYGENIALYSKIVD